MYKLKKLLHFLVWTLVFFRGIFDIINVPSYIYKVSFPIILIILFIITNIKQTRGVRFLVILIVISSISFIKNDLGFFPYLYFCTYIFSGYIYYLIVLNEKNILLLNWIARYLIILFFVQIIASFIKFVLVGVTEDYIGTISTSSGSMTTIFTLFSIVIILSHFYYKRGNPIVSIFLILGFSLFGLIGNKRALVFLIPAIFLFSYGFFLRNNKRLFNKETVNKLFIIMIFAFFSFYIASRTLPSLNPEGLLWGSFDPEFAINYAKDYTNSESRSTEEMRRLDAMIYLPNLLLEKGYFTFLFGDGPGKILQSRYIEGSDQTSTILKYYGVRYGARMGFVWLWIQIGLLGTLTYGILLIDIVRYSLRNNNDKILSIIIPSFLIVIMFDMSFYSYTYVKSFLFNGIFFFILVIASRGLEINIFGKKNVIIKR